MLHDNGLMKLCLGYVMQKLKDMTKLCNKAVQMVEILASMCDCKGVPVEQNQSKSSFGLCAWGGGGGGGEH